jgi:Zn-dependent protease with chaperone function
MIPRSTEGAIQYEQIEIGTRIALKEIKKAGGKDSFLINCDGKDLYLDLSDIKGITFDDPSTNDQLWQIIAVNSGLYENLGSKGFQYDLRSDLEDETINLLSNYQRYIGFFEDEYLEDYIQSLLNKIHPVTLDDGRPGNLVIKILRNNNPGAFSTPTGTIVIYTGLLSTIRSEDELIGVLAHEVAHFVLDHQIVNINKAYDRKKRAEFWSALATVMAAATEVYLAEKKDVYMGGNLTIATAVLSTSIANSVLERLGANFSREQEFEADHAATKTLEFLKKDPKAFAAALARIRTYCILTGDYLALSGAGTHPALTQRIAQIGAVDPEQFNSKKYDQLISFINTYNAINEYGQKHLASTLQLTNRNIEAGVATEEDYLLKGMVLRALFDTPERNQEALDLIVKSRTLNILTDYFPQTYKQEGITLLRLGRKQDAINAFQIYIQKLEAQKEKTQYMLDELVWARKMIYKTKAN